jgi:hypothetical protein
MPTKPDKTRQALSPEQETALDLMLVGVPDEQIGQQVGRCRQTICGWRRDPLFLAALNGRRRDLFGAQEDRLRALLPKSLDVLDRQLDEGNVTAALAIIGRSGLTVPPAGSERADVIEAEQRQADVAAMLSMMTP